MTNQLCSYCGEPHDHIGSGVICNGKPVNYKLPFKNSFSDMERPRKINDYPRFITVFYAADNLLYPDTK